MYHYAPVEDALRLGPPIAGLRPLKRKADRAERRRDMRTSPLKLIPVAFSIWAVAHSMGGAPGAAPDRGQRAEIPTNPAQMERTTPVRVAPPLTLLLKPV